MKKVEKNTNDYMALTYGSDWYTKIDESADDANQAFDAIDHEFEDDPEWQEAAASETYWGGQIELGGTLYWIASEYETRMSGGTVFLVEA